MPGSETTRFDAGRVLTNLRLLDERTGGADGARRLAWTDDWEAARDLVIELAGSGFLTERDRAGNLWFLPRVEHRRLLVLGSHIDAVPAGGWLDGALGVLAGLEVARAAGKDETDAEIGVAVVDWADEEGARFGFSLFGSSAFTGALDPGQVAGLRDAEGIGAEDALRRHGVELEELDGPDPRLSRIMAYLELHIEQGPVLDRAGLAGSAVSGTVGIERDRLIFKGQAAHAGPTPMDARQDAFLAASETALALEKLAKANGGRATTGRLELEPGIATAVAGEATLFTDLRHADADHLAGLRADGLKVARRAATQRGCSVSRERIWRIGPRAFDPRLVAATEDAWTEVLGRPTGVIESGALHDAAEMAPLVPTAMVFCASRDGLSHCPEEDSDENALLAACRVLDHLTQSILSTGLLPTNGVQS